jgi:hypothetical protein
MQATHRLPIGVSTAFLLVCIFLLFPLAHVYSEKQDHKNLLYTLLKNSSFCKEQCDSLTIS